VYAIRVYADLIQQGSEILAGGTHKGLAFFLLLTPRSFTDENDSMVQEGASAWNEDLPHVTVPVEGVLLDSVIKLLEP
jgi:hypothetical protein